jgi:peroxiredoxin
MTDITPLVPRQPVPDLTVPLVGRGRTGSDWSVANAEGDPFTMIVVYRGLHCPICKGYIGGLDRMVDKFAEKGVEVIAVSTDPAERAARAVEEWKLEKLPVGHSLSLDTARRWGLYVSTSRGMTSAGVEEPALFAEPGLFFVRPDKTLYFASTQTMPFARPKFEEILPAIDFVVANNYPARGEVDTLPAAA